MLENILIKKLEKKDVEDAKQIFIDAFDANQNRAERLEFLHEIYPEGWLVAYVENKMVGIVASFDFCEFVYIGFMAVLKAQQKMGVGKALMTEVINLNKDREILLDASEAGYRLYESLGFKPVDKANTFYISKMVLLENDSKGIMIQKVSPKDLKSIFLYDRKIFGADRSKLLASLFERFKDDFYFAKEPYGEIIGYAVLCDYLLGPFIADRADVAKRLIGITLKDKKFPITVIVPSKNEEAISISSEIGTYQRHCVQMRLGSESADLQRRPKIFGQASFATG